MTETTVENDHYKIVFTNQGAQVRHWILKKYNDAEGKPLDMVQPQARRALGCRSRFNLRAGADDSVESGAVSGGYLWHSYAAGGLAGSWHR